jgi:methylmalonyl-CoA/ethylmalonyl-CoA epimerase
MSTGKDQRRPFKQVFQIGVVVRDMDKAVERFTQLGLGPFKSFPPPASANSLFRGKRFVPDESFLLMKTQMGNIELELLQPLEAASPIKEFLDTKGEGIHHIGLFVDDLDAEVESLNKKGATTLLSSEMQGEGVQAYVDLNASGLVVELVKSSVFHNFSQGPSA